jgi:hypothetical protein
VYRILLRKHFGRQKWKNNIKVDLREVCCKMDGTGSGLHLVGDFSINNVEPWDLCCQSVG